MRNEIDKILQSERVKIDVGNDENINKLIEETKQQVVDMGR